MTRCRKEGKRRVSSFKFLSQKISQDVERVLLDTSVTQNECSCGCSRPVKSVLSIASQKYFCSKGRWLKLLGIRRSRIRELSEVSEMILGSGSTEETFAALDLNLVKSDISRQLWMVTEDQVRLAERSIYTFCLYNNVAYWQGMHDLAAALAHLEPAPTVGELTALIERLVNDYAPILFSPSANDVAARANELALKWRLLFKYFFPRASHDYDRFCESSFSVGWFMTLGFYRFGCAYISLAYTFLMVISRYDCLSSFMFRELGYIAARGYINYLNRQGIPVDFNNSVIFSNFSNASLIVNTLVNSNKIVLESEEFINISKNLYDTFNGRDFELCEFPLLYIFNSANILLSSAPSVFGIDASKEFLEVSESDLFSPKRGMNLFESQLSNEPNRTLSVSYRGRRGHKPLAKRKTVFSFTQSIAHESIAHAVGCEIAYSYISSFRRFGQLCRYNTKAALNLHRRSDFVFGNVLNANALYNVVDLRSQYLRSGMALENIFGSVNTSFVKDVVATHVFEDAYLDTNFTFWIVLTDEGYEAGGSQDSLVSLNRGLEVMRNLSRNSITCVSLFRGGYKGLLRSVKAPVPEPPSILSRISVRRLWGDSQPAEFSPGRNLATFATSISTAALDIESRIVQGISDMRLFGLFRHSQTLDPGGIGGGLDGTNPSTSHPGLAAYRTHELDAVDYKVVLSTADGLELSVRSNGRVKLNGSVLQPSEYSSDFDQNVEMLMAASTFLALNSVDGILDLQTSSYPCQAVEGAHVGPFRPRRDSMLRRFVVVLSPFEALVSGPLWHQLTLAAYVTGSSSSSRIGGLSRLWRFCLLKRKRLITHLIDCSLPSEQPESSGCWTSTHPDSHYTGCNSHSDTNFTESLEPLSHLGPAPLNAHVPDNPAPKLFEVRNVKVFSRTSDARAPLPVVPTQLPLPTLESRMGSIPGSARKPSILYANTSGNVFVSRSSLNRRQNSRP